LSAAYSSWSCCSILAEQRRAEPGRIPLGSANAAGANRAAVARQQMIGTGL
jgi:hypothetical protein